jgi:hypothetical protein
MGESNVTDRQEPKTGADSTRLAVSLEQQQQQQRDVLKAGVSHNEHYEDKGVLPKVTVVDDTPKEVAPPPGVPALRPSKHETSKPTDAPAPQRLGPSTHEAHTVGVLTPALAAHTDKASEPVKHAEPFKLEAKEEALSWDKWNDKTFREFGDACRLSVAQIADELAASAGYAKSQSDRPHLLAKYDVTFESDGTISNVQLKKASGNALFDQQVKRGIDNIGSSGRLQFPEGSTVERRTIEMKYGWNSAERKGYPTGQVEVNGQLQKPK